MVFTNFSISTITNASGFYSLAITAGIYDLTAANEPAYYANSSITVSTELSATVMQDIELIKEPTETITRGVKSA